MGSNVITFASAARPNTVRPAQPFSRKPRIRILLDEVGSLHAAMEREEMDGADGNKLTRLANAVSEARRHKRKTIIAEKAEEVLAKAESAFAVLSYYYIELDERYPLGKLTEELASILSRANAKTKEANGALQSGSYRKALALAVEAHEIILPQTTTHITNLMQRAEEAMHDAEIEGRTEGLDDAETHWSTAAESFNIGKYSEAHTAARFAEALAISSVAPKKTVVREEAKDVFYDLPPEKTRGSQRHLAMKREKWRNTTAITGRAEKEQDEGVRSYLEARVEALEERKEKRIDMLRDKGILPSEEAERKRRRVPIYTFRFDRKGKRYLEPQPQTDRSDVRPKPHLRNGITVHNVLRVDGTQEPQVVFGATPFVIGTSDPHMGRIFGSSITFWTVRRP